MLLELRGLSFRYPASPVAVLQDVSLTLAAGWTGVVGANGVGKSTLLQLACGILSPSGGQVRLPGASYYCPQSTQTAPPELEDFVADWGAVAGRLRAQLHVGDDWPWRFATLSHGERKRLQVAVALWRQPHVLALDEPSNHLDAEGRAWVLDALREYRGVGLLVSHDRALLDALATRCVLLQPGQAQVFPGNYSETMAQVRQEAAARQHARVSAEQRLARLRQEMQRRQADAARSDGRRSKRHLARGDSDGRARIGLAIVSGKDAVAGRRSAQLERRLERAAAAVAAIDPLTRQGGRVWSEGQAHAGNWVAALPAQRLSLGGALSLEVPDLYVGARDRIAVLGPNGAGKSSLLELLARQEGRPGVRTLYVAQELDAAQGARLIEDVRSRSTEELGRLLAMVARLGSAPEPLLSGGTLSPGELRKLCLAAGLQQEVNLFILDEVTNHLDLPAMEALEEALSESAAAMVVVSHDARFIARLCTVQWRIAVDGEQRMLQVVV